MRDRIINILMFATLWFVSWYFGAYKGGAYDGVLNGLDLLAITSGLGGMYYFYRAIMGIND